MKTVLTTSFLLPNGDLLLGCNGTGSNRMFFVKNSDGIFVYSEDEMDEIYNGLVPADTHLLSQNTDFLNWKNSDNVVKTEKGYKTQCTQYRKEFNKTELYTYFVREYAS